MDDYNNEILEQCNFDFIQNTGDQEHVANNSLKAYMLQENSSNCELMNENDISVHSESFIIDCDLATQWMIQIN